MLAKDDSVSPDRKYVFTVSDILPISLMMIQGIHMHIMIIIILTIMLDANAFKMDGPQIRI